MISIRKLMDDRRKSHEGGALRGWRSNLAALAASANRAVPGLGIDLKQKFGPIQDVLVPDSGEEALFGAQLRIEEELSDWADAACAYHTNSVQLLREIMSTISRAGDDAVLHHETYVQRFGTLNGQLRAIAGLEDLPVLRQSILDCTHALKACIEKMAEDGKESVRKLSNEVADYRAKLEESERLSFTDVLTQLANRRAFESRLDQCIEARQEFCVIIMDLNGFKGVNDRFGHLAGDDLLKQFADELRSQFRMSDLVARWGGDEFGVIVEGNAEEANNRAARIRRWVFGDYKINHNENVIRVEVRASIGIAEWDGKETSTALIARADEMLYLLKKQRDTARAA